jgi:hypothetical protein
MKILNEFSKPQCLQIKTCIHIYLHANETSVKTHIYESVSNKCKHGTKLCELHLILV